VAALVTIDGFEGRMIDTDGGAMFAAIAGEGPPLVLLHGFPQTHVMWGRVAPQLSRSRQVICLDLPGYGESFPSSFKSSPSSSQSFASSSQSFATKRAMAVRVCDAMTALGHDRFDIAGHDRGGRVAYRLALDSPERVRRLAVLDILPTCIYWEKMDHAFAMKVYHWPFLAQPAPLPETLIGGAPDYYIKHTLASWTAVRDLSAFDFNALEAYCAQARDPVRLKAMCDDYRAGEAEDVAHDKADRAAGRKIAAPTLALWGGAGIAAGAATPLNTWEDWCEDVRGEAIDSGHFIPEENPAATIAALDQFFTP
jgi:haloacetate dehalogenase